MWISLGSNEAFTIESVSDSGGWVGWGGDEERENNPFAFKGNP